MRHIFVILLIFFFFEGCANRHHYPVGFDDSYTLSGRNYTFAIYNSKNQLMTHPLRDLQLQVELRKKLCSSDDHPKISDVYIVSHGWNYSATEAFANYHKYIELADGLWEGGTQKSTSNANAGNFEPFIESICKQSTGFNPYFIFVTWTSTTRPLSDLGTGILPLGIDNVLQPIFWAVDIVAFHVPSAWKQSLNAANNAVGKDFPNEYLLEDWRATPFGTETQYFQHSDRGIGRDLPLSALIYELIKCRVEEPELPHGRRDVQKCLWSGQSIRPDFLNLRIHLVGHSYGAKLVTLGGMEALRRWVLLERLDLKSSEEIADEEVEEIFPGLSLGPEDDIAGQLICGASIFCPDETQASTVVKEELEKLEKKKSGYPISSLVLFNPAFHAGELWYSTAEPRWGIFPKSPASLLGLIPRKGLVYSRGDFINGTLFNIREMIFSTQMIQSFQHKIEHNFHFSKIETYPNLLFDIPLAIPSIVWNGAWLYIIPTLGNLPFDFVNHLNNNDSCWNPEETNTFTKPLFWLANTVDFFVPLCWPPGPFRDEDKQGLFRLSRPGLGKTGINKLVKGRNLSINLFGLTSLYDKETGKPENAIDFHPEQFCKFSYDSRIPRLETDNLVPTKVRGQIFSFDASEILFFHSDLRSTKRTTCDESKEKEKLKFTFNFVIKFTQEKFWEDPILQP